MATRNSILLSVAALLAFAAQVNAAVIDNSGITATASTSYNGNTGPERTLGTGLNTSFDPPQHSNSNASGWLSTSPNNAVQWIQWDLGQSYTLDSIRVWNWNQSGVTGNSIQQLDIYISSIASPGDPEGAGSGNWTLWVEDATFTQAPGANGYVGFDLETEVSGTLPTTAIRWVRFEADSHYGNTILGSAVGISEVQFSGTAIPEPGVALLGGIGALMLLMRRKRD